MFHKKNKFGLHFASLEHSDSLCFFRGPTSIPSAPVTIRPLNGNIRKTVRELQTPQPFRSMGISSKVDSVDLENSPNSSVFVAFEPEKGDQIVFSGDQKFVRFNVGGKYFYRFAAKEDIEKLKLGWRESQAGSLLTLDVIGMDVQAGQWADGLRKGHSVHESPELMSRSRSLEKGQIITIKDGLIFNGSENLGSPASVQLTEGYSLIRNTDGTYSIKSPSGEIKPIMDGSEIARHDKKSVLITPFQSGGSWESKSLDSLFKTTSEPKRTFEEIRKDIPDDATHVRSLDGKTIYAVLRDANGNILSLKPVLDASELTQINGSGKIPPTISGLTGTSSPEPIDGSNYGRQAVTSSASNSANTSGQSEASVTVNGQQKNLTKNPNGFDDLILEEENLHLQTFRDSNGDLLIGVGTNDSANGSIKLHTCTSINAEPIDIVDPAELWEIRPGNVIETTSSNGSKKYFRVAHDSSGLDIKLEKIDSLPNRAQLIYEEKNVEVSRSSGSVVLDGQTAIPDAEGLSTIPGTNILSFVAHDKRDGNTTTDVYVTKNNEQSQTQLKVHRADGLIYDNHITAYDVRRGDVIEEITESGKVQFFRVKTATTEGIELETINKPAFSINFKGETINSLPGIELDLPGTTINFFNNEPFGQTPKLRATARKESDQQSSEKSKLIHHTVGGKYEPQNGDGYLISPGDILQEVNNTNGKTRYFKILSTTDNNVQIEELASLPSGFSRFGDQVKGILGIPLTANNSSNNTAKTPQTPPTATTSRRTRPVKSATNKSRGTNSDNKYKPEEPKKMEKRGLTGKGTTSNNDRNSSDKPAIKTKSTKKVTGQPRQVDKQPEVKKRKGLGQK